MLVEQKNAHSTQKYSCSVNTTLRELEQYLGMLLKMGFAKMSNVRCNWENGTRYSIADNMARNRFLKLMQCINVVNNLEVSEEAKKDTLWKVRPWISLLQRNRKNIEQEEFNAVDEIKVPFTGRCSLKQYIPNKQTPWGFKLWGRAGITGVLHQFEVYQGHSKKNTCLDLVVILS